MCFWAVPFEWSKGYLQARFVQKSYVHCFNVETCCMCDRSWHYEPHCAVLHAVAAYVVLHTVKNFSFSALLIGSVFSSHISYAYSFALLSASANLWKSAAGQPKGVSADCICWLVESWSNYLPRGLGPSAVSVFWRTSEQRGNVRNSCLSVVLLLWNNAKLHELVTCRGALLS